MSTIVTRSGKGSPLTNTEVDSNFTNLNTDKAELSGATFTGEITANGGIALGDNDKATFGASDDLQIYHDGANSYIQNATNSLIIQNDSDDKQVIIKSDNGSGGVTDYFRANGTTGEATLYHYGSSKIATTATGIDVTGISVSDGMSTNTLGTSNFIAGVTAGNSMLAGSNNNVIVGDSAGTSISTGGSNVAIGSRALESSTVASGNTAIGYRALRDNTSGTSNTGVGAYALLGNPTGNNNSAFGYNSLGAPLNTGNYNSGFGGSTLSSNIGGAFNTGIGAQSLSGNTEGDDNTSVGYQSLNTNTTGSKNLCIGKLAGKDIITGSNNTIIGEYTGSASLADTVVICSGTTPRIIINSAGDASIQDGNLNIATTSTPASATATGITGTIAWDASYVYVCTATNTWKRTAISTW